MGSARRDRCTTADNSRARANVERLESQRQIHVQGSAAQRQFQADKDLLNKWKSEFLYDSIRDILHLPTLFAALHENVGDTGQMEDLPDIASGQSHRAALQASMRALESQFPQRGGHTGRPRHNSFGGRGGGESTGLRGHGVSISHHRTTSMANPKAGHIGVPQRSTTVSFGLDPALNSNNDPNENDSRGHKRTSSRGSRGNGYGRARGGSQQRGIVPVSAQRPSRPDINFVTKMADPESFLTSYRRMSEMSPVSMQANAPTQPSKPEPPSSLVKENPGEKKTPSKQKVTPLETPKTPSRVVPLEKTAQFTKPNAQAATPKPSVVGRIEGTRETPTSPSRSVTSRKIFKPKAPVPSVKIFQPADIGPPDKEIKWKVAAGEHPRKKVTPVPEPTTPVSQTIKPKPKDGRLPTQRITKKQENENQVSQSGSLLDTANCFIPGHELLAPIAATTPACKVLSMESPGAVDLLGLRFSPEESPKSISEVISRAKNLPTSLDIEFERLLAKRLEEELENRMKHAQEILKRPSEKIARFEDWLNQAEKSEAAAIKDALRKASFTGYREPSRTEEQTDSSTETTPVRKSKVPASVRLSRDIAEDLKHQNSGVDTASSVTPVVTQAPVRIASVPANEVPLSAKAISTQRPVAKQPSLNDSIYASMYATPRETSQSQNTASAPRVFSGNIPKPQDPKATGVRVIGPAPYDPQKKYGIPSLSSRSENNPSTFSVNSDPTSRVKVVGVQPYNPDLRK